jgi:preprotein translocase subunit YajC
MKKLLLLVPTLFMSASMYAQDAANPRQQGAFWQTLIMIGIAIVFFYFILWRPEQKRRKAMEKKRSEMKKGDKVTAMGIVGTIDRIKEGTVVLKMVDGSKIEMLKGAISEVLPTTEETEEKDQA